MSREKIAKKQLALSRILVETTDINCCVLRFSNAVFLIRISFHMEILPKTEFLVNFIFKLYKFSLFSFLEQCSLLFSTMLNDFYGRKCRDYILIFHPNERFLSFKHKLLIFAPDFVTFFPLKAP